MNPSYLVKGDADIAGGPTYELINSGRAQAYASSADIPWLRECSECPEAAQLAAPAPDRVYVSPAADPAPWYDAERPDTADFLGIVGLEVSGIEDSTMTANLTEAISGGGVVGPAYAGPREMVVRAMAIAASECGLAAGLDWIRCQFHASSECGGDTLTYFDCCPPPCAYDDVNTDCWVATYAQLESGPTSCTVDYWPSTYAQLRLGPSEGESEDFCSWIVLYRDLTSGPSDLSCAVAECIEPYLRQLYGVRLIEGPSIISRPNVSKGALAVIEFVIVATQPAEHTLTSHSTYYVSNGDGVPYVDPPTPDPPTPGDDPFGLGPVIRRSDLLPTPIDPTLPPMLWNRETTTVVESTSRVHLGASVHLVRLLAQGNAGRVRISIDDGGNRENGYYMPFLPAGASLSINAISRQVTTPEGLETRRVDGFVSYYDGTALRWETTVEGDLTLVIDRAPGDTVPVTVEVISANVGCP